MHTDFTYRLRAGIAALVLALGLLGVAVHRADAAPPAPCEEDQPCWDCTTMGNRICGPIPVRAEPTFTG